MAISPILFAGGTGSVGKHALRWFRARHPKIAVLVGSRKLEAATELATKVGNASPVVIDADKPHLGVGKDVKLGAVVMLAPDGGLNGLSLAQDAGVPFFNIVSGMVEIAPEVAHFAYHASKSPVVLASHWMAGAATILALQAAKRLGHIEAIRIGVVLDEQDPAGPAAIEDMERLRDVAKAAMVFDKGRRMWLPNEQATTKVRAIDGRSVDAIAYSIHDVMSLQAVTRAASVRIDIASAPSSSRLRGGSAAAEFVVEAEGGGKHARATLEFPEGCASLTALSVVLGVGCLLGLNDRAPAKPGLYMPEQLCDHRWFLDQLQSAGATITES